MVSYPFASRFRMCRSRTVLLILMGFLRDQGGLSESAVSEQSRHRKEGLEMLIDISSYFKLYNNIYSKSSS